MNLMQKHKVIKYELGCKIRQLSWKIIQNVNKLVFNKCIITMLNVYDEDGNTVTNKYLNINNSSQQDINKKLDLLTKQMELMTKNIAQMQKTLNYLALKIDQQNKTDNSTAE